MSIRSLSLGLLAFVLVLGASLRTQTEVPESWDRARTAAEQEAFVASVCASDSDLARRKALELWSRPSSVELRVRLLRHAAGLADIDASMLAVAEKAGSAGERVVAVRWFLDRHGAKGLEAMQVLGAEKREPALDQALLAAMAGSTLEDARAAFAQRYSGAGYEDRLVVLELLADVDNDGVHDLREDLARKADGLLQAEALAQQIARGEARAVRRARQLLRQRPDVRSRARLFDALLGHARPSDLQLCAQQFADADVRMLDVLRARLAGLAANADVRQWVLESGIEARESKVRHFAARILHAMPAELAEPALLKLATGDDDVLRRDALLLASERGAPGVDGLIGELLRADDLSARLDGLEALERGAALTEPLRARVLELARSTETDERYLALCVLAQKKVPGLLDELGSLLQERDWRLRSAAYRYAARVRAVQSIEVLIDALAREQGRLAYECRVALNSLTRLWYEDASRWAQWWAQEKGAYALPPAPEESTQASAAESPSDTKVEFYGIPVHSTRVLYCLDVSGSMNERVGTGQTRMDLAKRALKSALEKAPRGSQVNVLFFDTHVHVFAKKLVDLARVREREKLFAFIDESSPLGGTNLYGVLDAALEQTDADTIYLLSDGDPSTGAILDPLELAEDVLRRNRSKGLVIHAVSIGLDSVLLRRLAAASGGQYVRSE